MNGRKDEWIEEQTDRRMDRWKDRLTDLVLMDPSGHGQGSNKEKLGAKLTKNSQLCNLLSNLKTSGKVSYRGRILAIDF